MSDTDYKKEFSGAERMMIYASLFGVLVVFVSLSNTQHMLENKFYDVQTLHYNQNNTTKNYLDLVERIRKIEGGNKRQDDVLNVLIDEKKLQDAEKKELLEFTTDFGGGKFRCNSNASFGLDENGFLWVNVEECFIILVNGRYNDKYIGEYSWHGVDENVS